MSCDNLKTKLQLIKDKDRGYLLLWIIFVVFPLMVVPHHHSIVFLGKRYPPDFYYLPRLIFLAVLALPAVFYTVRNKISLGRQTPWVWPLAAFIFFALISTSLAAYPATAWLGHPLRRTGMLTYILCVVVFLLSYSAAGREKTDRLLGAGAVTAALVSLVALLQCWGLHPVPQDTWRSQLSWWGTMAAPSFLGVYAAFFLPAALSKFLQGGRACWLVAVMGLWTGVLLSLSRTSWLAGLTGLIMISLPALGQPQERKNLLSTLLALTAVTAVSWFDRGSGLAKAATATVYDGLLLVPLQHYGPNLKELSLVWGQCLTLFRCAWDFGIGPDHLVYARVFSTFGIMADKARNIFLDLGVSMGGFALLSYLVFLSFFFRFGSRQKSLLTVMGIVYLLQGFFLPEDPVLMPLFWGVLGMAAAERALPAAESPPAPAEPDSASPQGQEGAG